MAKLQITRSTWVALAAAFCLVFMLRSSTVHTQWNNRIESKISISRAQATSSQLILALSQHKTGTVQMQCIIKELAPRFGSAPPVLIPGPGKQNIADYIRSNQDSRLFYAIHAVATYCGKTCPDICPCNGQQQHCLEYTDTCQLSIPTTPADTAIIHFIRNPIDIVVSAYRYHAQDPPPEKWLNGLVQDIFTKTMTRDPGFIELATDLGISTALPSSSKNKTYSEYLRSLDPSKGIILEFWRSLHLLYAMARQSAAVNRAPHGFDMKFEDFRDDYEGSLRQLLDIVGIEEAPPKELMDRLYKCDPGHWDDEKKERSAHVTSSSGTGQDLEAVLLGNSKVKWHLCRIGKLLGYSDPRCR